MKHKFEVSVRDYGGMLFDVFVGRASHIPLPEHFKSIEAKARPLIQQLLELNSEMAGGGYAIYDYVNSSGKRIKREWERIKEAQATLWGVLAADVKEGDKIWVTNGDYEMTPLDCSPVEVEFVKKDYIGVTLDRDDVIAKIWKRDSILLAPADFEQHRSRYSSKEFWLEKANELGI